MSTLIYWHGRLQARMPIWDTALMLPRQTFKPKRNNHTDTWPHSVARETLYQDYQAWHEKELLEPYRDMPYFQASPESMPAPDIPLTFYATLGPLIYVAGKKAQTRTYSVDTRKFHKGEWFEAKESKYFVRLVNWEDHVAAFEIVTGMSVAQAYQFDPQKAERVARAKRAYLDRASETRERMLANTVGA